MANRTSANPSETQAPLVGVFQTLAQEHQELSALLEAIKAEPASRAALWLKARAEMLSHDRGEMREVFPVIRANLATRALADLHDADAKAMEMMVMNLTELPLDSELWMPLFTQLADTVVQHATEEETSIFPQAQQALGEAVAEQLNAKFVECKLKLVDAV